jgi:hypothetical protein
MLLEGYLSQLDEAAQTQRGSAHAANSHDVELGVTHADGVRGHNLCHRGRPDRSDVDSPGADGDGISRGHK